MFRISSLPRDWHGLFPWIRIRRKNELRTRIYEGIWSLGQYPDHDQRHGTQGKPKKSTKKTKMSVPKMLWFATKVAWMLISSCLVSLKLQGRKGIPWFARWLIRWAKLLNEIGSWFFTKNLDRIFILNPCQSRGFLLKGFYHVKRNSIVKTITK